MSMRKTKRTGEGMEFQTFETAAGQKARPPMTVTILGRERETKTGEAKGLT